MVTYVDSYSLTCLIQCELYMVLLDTSRTINDDVDRLIMGDKETDIMMVGK